VALTAAWPVRQGASLVTQRGGIRGTFNASGAALRVGRVTVGFSLAGVGRGHSLDRVAAVAPTPAANQVLYRHGPISEFYRNGPYGLEQGFTVPKPPQAGSGPLVVALGISGSLLPEQVGSQVFFRTKSGVTALRYGQLSAVDAAGRRLPAHMQIRNGTLELLIDDSNARYPLRIDPFIQQQELTGGGEIGPGGFGTSVALSGDGTTALIGAPDDNTTGVGAAWVFTLSNGVWTQQAKLTQSDDSGNIGFGASVALSGDGNTALIGASKNLGLEARAAWVFTRSGSTWTQQAEITDPLPSDGRYDLFGNSVALSGDGNTALIGASKNLGLEARAAWVFTRSGSTWTQQAEITDPLPSDGRDDLFGNSVALSGDGNTALIGGLGTGGAAWVFTRSGSTWTQQGERLTGSGAGGEEINIGSSVALSADGNTALIGDAGDSAAWGAAWMFTRSDGVWTQQGDKLTGQDEEGDVFGGSVALSSDGNTALIGQDSYDADVGAAWVFTRSDGVWTQLGGPLVPDSDALYYFGQSVALSGDGNTALVGGPWDNHNAGDAWVFVSGLPTVVTGAASAVTQSSATLNATVNPNGGDVSDCHFQYGTTSLYGSSAPCATPPGSGNSAVAVAAPVGSLAKGTTYHFRIAATNSRGTSYGSDETFTSKKAAATERISLDGSTIDVQRNHEALIKLTCTGTATCRGKLTLTAKSAGKKGKNGKPKKIGTAAFSIPAGKTKTIKLTLSRTGRAFLSAAHGHLSASLTILKTFPTPSTSQSHRVHLVQQKAKKRKK
jgi:hypothetical protein